MLHLVRDPRAVLYSRLALEAFCGGHGETRKCVQPLCQGYRATLRGITAYLSTLEGRPYWQFYKFKRIKFEEVRRLKAALVCVARTHVHPPAFLGGRGAAGVDAAHLHVGRPRHCVTAHHEVDHRQHASVES